LWPSGFLRLRDRAHNLHRGLSRRRQRSLVRRLGRIRHRCPLRAQRFLELGSSTQTIVMIRAREEKIPEVRMAATVADAAAWAVGTPAGATAATAGEAVRAMKSGRKRMSFLRRQKRSRSR